MDHGDMGDSGGMGGMSGMYFHLSVHNTILFEGWHTMNWQELLGSCVGIALLAALYEGFKVLRDYLDVRMAAGEPKSVPAIQMTTDQPCECHITDQTSSRTTTTTTDSVAIAIGEGKEHKTKSRPAIISCRHVVQTVLHFVQLWIGFCLMLIFMTYSVYICLAVTVGGAIGYFCFAWMRKRPPAASVLPSVNAECCQ